MGDGRISQHHGYIGNTQAFFVEEIPRMFHALTLVEIKNGGSKEFLESFFQITFVDGHFTAEFPDGERFADMFQ